MWDAAKAVLGGKFIALNAYVRKDVWFKIDHLSFHLRKLEKEEQIKCKVNSKIIIIIIKIRAKINEIKTRKSVEKIRKTKN